LAKKSCKVHFGNTPGVALFLVDRKGKRFVFGNFQGYFVLVQEDKVKDVEGNINTLDVEKW
jgi:hypothetical protein